MLLATCGWLLAANALGLGNTVGYHRLLTHRAFRARAPVRVALTLLGALHAGSPLVWVALHRLHHAKSDGPGDPHSPTRGFWAAHAGWVVGTRRPLPAALFALSGFGQQAVILVHDLRRLLGRRPPTWLELCPDLRQERLMRLLDVPLVMPALFALQLGLAWAVARGWGLLWLWSLHLVLTNTSWAVNSICHWPRFGVRRWETTEGSRDVAWLGPLTHGESFHNAHHRFPRSACHALEGGWDASWWLIRGLCALGLAREPWLPRRYRQLAGRAAPGG